MSFTEDWHHRNPKPIRSEAHFHKTPQHDDQWRILASYLGKKSFGSLVLNSCKATFPMPMVALDAASKAT